ncbi:Nn.00g038260.m01.CDS01 [Neocucurbitaria sp. VM-36]
MFHEGSLQSGITLAIQQQKLVACFVRDDGATSKEWEDEWLKSGWISNLLAQKAVLLRLQAGSTEAGFLAAFCDTKIIPTFIVIQNGQLQLQLSSDVTKDVFTNSIRKVLGAEAIPGSGTAQAAPPQASTPELSQMRTTLETEEDLYGATSPFEPARPAAPTPAATSTSSAKAKGKQKATSSPETKPVPLAASVSSAQKDAREALRKKKREEAEELARIKARIEADKAERKAQAEARKAERERERDTNAQSEAQLRTATSSRGSQAKIVNLNVRLFDGRTIRSTFARTATLQEDVRSWIDEEFAKLSADDPNIDNKRLPPYFFRHILAPQPSRELSAGDESQSLGDIDLAPSATLVLVPVKGYTEAYSGAGGGVVGTATGLLGGALGLVSSTVGFVGSALGSVVGYGSAPTEAQTGQTTESRLGQGSQRPASSEGSSIRVTTLADQRAREPRDQQFYNGNQLDTVPRKDDDDKRS